MHRTVRVQRSPINSKLDTRNALRAAAISSPTILDLFNDIFTAPRLVSSSNNVTSTDVREVVGDSVDDLLILRVTCGRRAHLPACCGSRTLAHAAANSHTRWTPRDIRRIIAYDITPALTNVLERMPTLRRFIMPVNEMWTNTGHQYISDYG